MFKMKLYIVFAILSLLALVSGACAESSLPVITVIPLEIPTESSPGEYIDFTIQVSSDQPCKLVLSTPHKTEVDNYLSPHTGDTLTFPNSDGTVVFHEQIPWETVPGSYVLRIIQMRYDGDTEGKEIFGQDLKIK